MESLLIIEFLSLPLQDFDKEISCHKIHSPSSGSHAHLPLHHQHHHPHHHSLHNHNSNNNNNEDDMEPTLLSPAHSNHSAYDSKEHVKELEFYKNLAAKAASLANQHRETSSASPLPMQIDADADDDEAEAEEQALRLRREEQAQAKAFAAHLNGTSEYISKAKRNKGREGRGNCLVK